MCQLYKNCTQRLDMRHSNGGQTESDIMSQKMSNCSDKETYSIHELSFKYLSWLTVIVVQ